MMKKNGKTQGGCVMGKQASGENADGNVNLCKSLKGTRTPRDKILRYMQVIWPRRFTCRNFI